ARAHSLSSSDRSISARTLGSSKRRSMWLAASKLSSCLKRRSGVNFMSSLGPSRPRRNFAWAFKALMISLSWPEVAAASTPAPSGSTKQVACFKSGERRTSVTVMETPAKASSWISSSRRMSTRAWRMSSPARSWRWLGPTGPEALRVCCLRAMGQSLIIARRGSDLAGKAKGGRS
ncbi:hypothetical protein LTR94_024951, partial [Friedmanniomyces endolithicus]